MMTKPCFKCGGNQGGMQQTRNNGSKFQPMDGPNPPIGQKKRMRPEDLDCDLDTLI